MLRMLLTCTLIFALAAGSLAQTDPPPPGSGAPSTTTRAPANDVPIWERLFVGGSIGAGFSNFATFIDVSPMVGYMLTDNWSVGPGYTYQFIRDKVWAETIHITGPRVFSRYHLFDWLFIHGEYEHIFFKWKSDITGDMIQVNAPGLHLGPGIKSGWDNRSGGFLVIMYNFLESTYTPHSRRNPIIQMGFTIGL